MKTWGQKKQGKGGKGKGTSKGHGLSEFDYDYGYEGQAYGDYGYYDDWTDDGNYAQQQQLSSQQYHQPQQQTQQQQQQQQIAPAFPTTQIYPHPNPNMSPNPLGFPSEHLASCQHQLPQPRPEQWTQQGHGRYYSRSVQSFTVSNGGST